MKKTILFLFLIIPTLTYAYPITITNSGSSKKLVILPVSPNTHSGAFSSLQINTMTSCLASPEGLSVMGKAATIPPKTTIVYNFNIPSDFLNVCPNIYNITSNANGNGALIVDNTYNVGLTVTQATQHPAFTFTMVYSYNYGLTPSENVQILGFSLPVPPYVTSYGQTYTALTVNADMIPPIE